MKKFLLTVLFAFALCLSALNSNAEQIKAYKYEKDQAANTITALLHVQIVNYTDKDIRLHWTTDNDARSFGFQPDNFDYSIKAHSDQTTDLYWKVYNPFIGDAAYLTLLAYDDKSADIRSIAKAEIAGKNKYVINFNEADVFQYNALAIRVILVKIDDNNFRIDIKKSENYTGNSNTSEGCFDFSYTKKNGLILEFNW